MGAGTGGGRAPGGGTGVRPRSRVTDSTVGGVPIAGRVAIHTMANTVPATARPPTTMPAMPHPSVEVLPVVPVLEAEQLPP
jgi:hypothetical protein